VPRWLRIVHMVGIVAALAAFVWSILGGTVEWLLLTLAAAYGTVLGIDRYLRGRRQKEVN